MEKVNPSQNLKLEFREHMDKEEDPDESNQNDDNPKDDTWLINEVDACSKVH